MNSFEEADVVVIGAGLSGLTAARRLDQAGHSVMVLEANERVGGRTVDLDVAHGVVTEGGGQWVGPGQDHVLALIEELGHSLFKTYVDGRTIYFREGRYRTYEGTIPPMGKLAMADFAQLQWRLERMAKTVPIQAPWTAPNAGKWDSTTFGHWLDANAFTTEAKWLFTLVFNIIGAEDPHRTSLFLTLFRIAACDGLAHMINTTGGAQESRIVGGSQGLSLTMAEQLGDRVVLASPVTGIDQSGEDVVVRSGRVDVRCRRVIVAMPPADAGRIRFTPDLPTRRTILQRAWNNGTESKLFAIYDTPFWREDGLNGQALTDLPVAKFVVDNSPPDGSVGILLTFIGTAGSGAEQTWPDELLDDPAARKAAVVRDLKRIFGPKAGQPVDYLEKNWVDEAWIDGCVSARPPGVMTQYTDAATAPVGAVHWAGTEAATRYEGYLDGAVSAGERAAREAGERLR
ncbi:MAG: FAD-dependent oxidoreductase [Salinisphaeraceae bacterium]